MNKISWPLTWIQRLQNWSKDVASNSNATTGSPNCSSQYFVLDIFDFRGGGICTDFYESAT